MQHTSSEHGVQEEDPSIFDVGGELLIEQAWLARLLVSLNQYLANPHTSAAVPQALLHGLAGTHDADTADLALELDAVILSADWGGDLMLDNRQVVETFLDQQTNDAVRVEDEVCAIGIGVADHAGQKDGLARDSREREMRIVPTSAGQ